MPLSLDEFFQMPVIFNTMLQLLENGQKNPDYMKVSKEIAERHMVKMYGEDILRRYKWVPYP